MSDALDRYIQAGEGIGVEFKRCGSQPGADTFETICSFANRQGGSILLGVWDNGTVEGVPGVSALSITVRARQLGRLSPPVALTVPAGEGVFYAGRAETFFRGQ